MISDYYNNNDVDNENEHDVYKGDGDDDDDDDDDDDATQWSRQLTCSKLKQRALHTRKKLHVKISSVD